VAALHVGDLVGQDGRQLILGLDGPERAGRHHHEPARHPHGIHLG
jgi:hypothetical protein